MSNLAQTWDTIKDAIIAFGWIKVTFTIFFWVAHYWLYRLYSGRLNDRQDEINRLAADNREYRDKFLAVLDKHFELPHKLERQALPARENPKATLPKVEVARAKGKDIGKK